MHLNWINLIAAGSLLAGCGAAAPDAAKSGPASSLEGDAALIASAQKISEAVGGCVRPADAQVQSKVVSLEGGAIVMLACSASAYSHTHRLFVVRANAAPQLVSLPDYEMSGWYATDQATMAELDAGTGVLTTYRKGSENGKCGSEGRYQWDGKRFAVQEMHWQDCAAAAKSGPPFPVIWPAQSGGQVDPNGPTPAP
jgi:Protein of unknown function (DUF1176)